MTEAVIAQDVSDGQRLGEGEFPGELDRLNWGAVLLAPAWAFVYSLWGWFFGFVALVVGQTAVMSYLGRADLPSAIPLAVLSMCRVAILAMYVVLGYRANRFAWERERRRVARESDESVPRLAAFVSHYSRMQRRWLWWGIGLLIYSCGVSFWSARKSTWQSRQQLILGFAMWATVIAGLAAVEWFRRRQRIAS